jgi:hypothetical protein
MEERKETHKTQHPGGGQLPRESIADRIREHRANQSRYKDRGARREKRGNGNGKKERKESRGRREGKRTSKDGRCGMMKTVRSAKKMASPRNQIGGRIKWACSLRVHGARKETTGRAVLFS